MAYYEIKIKQLIPEKAEQFEIVYNPGEKDEFAEPIEFFALCDLEEKAVKSDRPFEPTYIYDAILPVVYDAEQGLEAVITDYYASPKEQKARIRKK